MGGVGGRRGRGPGRGGAGVGGKGVEGEGQGLGVERAEKARGKWWESKEGGDGP